MKKEWLFLLFFDKIEEQKRDHMIYLDYSATTPANPEVVDTFSKVSLEYIGNPNSLHRLGVDAKHLMDAATKQVADLLHVDKEEVIFTSGASESNNLAIMGVLEKYPMRGNHILTTKLEHSSILECMPYLEKKGYQIDYVKVKEDGMIDLDYFRRLLTKDTVLVTIHHVNSEVGFCQNVSMIGEILKEYPTTIFHVDGTQALGKIPVSLEGIDLYSFSAHKFYGLKGCGGLIKKKHIELEPLIHGGKSQTIYRSGTPPLGLMVSTAKALRLALDHGEEKYAKVQKLNKLLKKELQMIDGVVVNSNQNCIPHIVNISVLDIKPETLLHALEEKEIYISTKTACSKVDGDSLTLTAIGKPSSISGHSLRVSLSHLTTEEEIHIFVDCLKQCMEQLTF